MKSLKSILLILLFFNLEWNPVYSQSSYCKNLGFELGNFTNWTPYTWRYKTDAPQVNTTPVMGVVARRHVIISDTSAYDKNTGYALRKVPKGCLYSARIGDEILSTDRANPRNWNQSLRYTMKIDSNNALLVFKFALVLEYANDHTDINEPRFRMTLYDDKGNILPNCSNYDVFSSSKYIKGFNTYIPTGTGADPVVWRDWTSVGANLLEYMGKTITVEFMTADCTRGYHYGYAYFVAECHPLYLAVDYCTNDSTARLIAPVGFVNYQWKNSSGDLLDTLQILRISVPKDKSIYSCTMTSATGCVITLNSKVLKYNPKADFSSSMFDCFSNTVGFENRSTKTNGSLAYDWRFEDGQTSELENPLHTFKTSGIHKVSLILKNSPSACRDTLTKDVESFTPPLVGISGDSTYCPGLTTWIKGYGAADYKWNNDSKADSLEIKSPGGKFWLIGYSTTGCHSDTNHISITEEPDWDFMAHGDSTICGNGSLTISASGASAYIWNTGESTDSLIVTSPGKYIVTGNNLRGCKKLLTYNVERRSIPLVDFIASPDAIDSRHNKINCTVPAEEGVNYLWIMGDGNSEKGSNIVHQYNISNSTLEYQITLAATSVYNCTDSSSKFIDVTPFVPNVFTPDGDGINDVFMPGFEQQIVDRNGLKIYNGNEGWDGRFNGENVDPDTYFYLVLYKDSRDVINTRKGYITLVRKK